MSSSALAPVAQEIDYPETDGEPMAETDWQAIPLMYAVTGLRDHFRGRDDVYVSGNLLIYYEEGNVHASVAPDVFVVMGVPSHPRPIYKLWEEAKAPDFVLEITSRSTRARDATRKRSLYRRLGVVESNAERQLMEQERQRALAARDSAEARLMREAEARRAAEARVAELEALLKRTSG